MQTILKIALAAVDFALAAIPAFAVEMPTDGSKNFSSPTDAPSYFTSETLPESARVDRAASFDEEDVGAATPDVGDTTQYARHTSPIGRPDTCRASPKATALRCIPPNEERGERRPPRRRDADPVLRDPHQGRLHPAERACDDGRVPEPGQRVPEIRHANASASSGCR